MVVLQRDTLYQVLTMQLVYGIDLLQILVFSQFLITMEYHQTDPLIIKTEVALHLQ